MNRVMRHSWGLKKLKSSYFFMKSRLNKFYSILSFKYLIKILEFSIININISKKKKTAVTVFIEF